ncbi:MAG: 3-methyl-2-oxobutanoate hydroxymethyltransferase [Lentisphaeria bacterium]|jgi:3-methyl-2-oxobutanoate hydroxymethyltransferase|nr:3-methyl-2-oxobutanoate hydroxymethyltransferase [Lentisphaerota bacterium]
MNKRISVQDFARFKSAGEKIVMITAYDACQAFWCESAGCHAILVGDSMGNTVLGYENTLPVTLEEMLSHSAAVRRASKSCMVIADLPFMSYQVSVEQALHNAGRCLKEAGADAVKLEGGSLMAPTLARLVQAGIPVMGHIGLLPQSVLKEGGYRLHGKSAEEAEALKKDALTLQEAGAFALVLEGIPAQLAQEISLMLEIPSIGIAAGPHCDGQVQVISDLLNLSGDKPPKHAKVYADLCGIATEAIRKYVEDVKQDKFGR